MAKKGSRKSIPIEEGLNLGSRTSEELRQVGIRTVEQLRKMGWEKALQKLVLKFPERNNLNMATSLIGAIFNCHWQKVPALDKARAKALIKSMKPKKQKMSKAAVDPSFRDFIVTDQLSEHPVDSRKMFGGYGLYFEGAIFGIIFRDRLYFKTSEATKHRYVAAGMSYFKPNATQSLKSYFEVPGDVLEDRFQLTEWAREAWGLS